MTIEEMKRKKEELGYSNEMVADLSGVPLGTVQKIFGGATQRPRHKTLQALEKVFRSSGTSPLAEAKTAAGFYPDNASAGSVLRDPGAAYAMEKKGIKRPGEYSLEDYYALPDDQRVELIDGVFYEMEAPAFVHQIICMEIASRIQACIREHGSPCRAVMAPCDVQLDRDDRTMVQPDVLVICDPEIIRKGVVFGAPVFVAEVLSPSTRKKDLTIKCRKYRDAGVREYWIIDPETKEAAVWLLDDYRLPRSFGERDRIPLAISEGKCMIDMGEIWDACAPFDR